MTFLFRFDTKDAPPFPLYYLLDFFFRKLLEL